MIDTHHGTCIVKLSAIVWSRKDGHQLALPKELVAILDDLMRTTDQIQVVLLQEPTDRVGAKGETDAPLILAPSRDVLVRIAPEEIAEEPGIGDIGRPHDPSDLVHAVEVR